MTTRQVLGLLVPLALVPSMSWTFRALDRRCAAPLGYLLGFVTYWFVWCLAVPALLLGGPRALLDAFVPFPAPGALSWTTHLALWLPVAFPLFAVFVPKARRARWRVGVASLALGVVIAVTEELLWRGVYTRLFPRSLAFGVVYPSAMFALWHIAPQTVVKNRKPGGTASFVAYAFVLGLAYAYAVRQTGSIAWSTLAHALHDTLGLGGFAYATWLAPAQGADPPPPA